MAASAPITLATIYAQLDSTPIELILTDGGWQGKGAGASDYAMMLAMMFNLRDYSPADGRLGNRQATAAARWLNERGIPATVEFPQEKPLPEGAVC
jgi:hypothetical protein